MRCLLKFAIKLVEYNEPLLFGRCPALKAGNWHLRRWPHIAKAVAVAGKLELINQRPLKIHHQQTAIERFRACSD
nr:hypothetical protein [Liquorilactobacillus mali]